MGKDSIIEFTYLIDKEVIVKFVGGRDVEGVLKGFDRVGNLIIENAIEITNKAPLNNTNTKIQGLLFARGPNISSVFPKSSYEEIDNPY